jgi:HD-GYP domain-containing protein (c-di-GMP phosphodiesterase class II)
MPAAKMSEAQLELYREHPKKGVELLDKYPSISEAVKQIVFQHHELITGEGFPNKLSGIKIYPLAKVVSFVNYYANHMMENKLSPLNALKELLADRRTLLFYDTAVVKALIQGFKKS